MSAAHVQFMTRWR